MARRSIVLAVALFLTRPFELAAQQEPPVQAGDRVRVRATRLSPRYVDGTLLSLSPDSFVIRVEDRAERLAIPLASLKKLEVRRGRKSHWVRGALVGLAFGAAMGSVAFHGLFGRDCAVGSQEWCWVQARTLLGAVMGTGIGAGVGASITSERWEAVPLDELRVGLGSRPARPL
jgi:hypothetical protein